MHWYPTLSHTNSLCPTSGELESGHPKRMWQGFQTITDYKAAPLLCEDNMHLNALSNYFGWFKALNSTPARKSTPHLDEQTQLLSGGREKSQPRKAAGPDNIPGRVFKDCADQLAHVLTDLFNTSLTYAVVPSCFKTAIIITVPKKPTMITTLSHSLPS